MQAVAAAHPHLFPPGGGGTTLIPDVPGLPLKQRYCVNTHMNYTNSGTPYANNQLTKDRIDYLGVDCVRDFAISTSARSDLAFLDVDVIGMCGGYFNTWQVEGSEASCVQGANAAIPRLVAAEGMNEPFSPCSSQPNGQSLQRLTDHITRIRNAAAPLGLDTYSFSSCRQSNWWTLPRIPGIVNNAHSHSVQGSYPTLSQLDNWMATTQFSDSGRYAATEMGLYEPVSNGEAFGARAQLVAGLHHLYRGAERFAFYELIDSGGQMFGFWSSGGAQRQSATAMHNFLNLLGEAKTAPLDGLTFSVSDPSNMAISLSLRTASAQYVALWNRSSTATRDVTLNLSEARTAAIHRPVTTPDGEVRGPSTWHVVSLGDDPVVVRIG